MPPKVQIFFSDADKKRALNGQKSKGKVVKSASAQAKAVAPKKPANKQGQKKGPVVVTGNKKAGKQVILTTKPQQQNKQQQPKQQQQVKSKVVLSGPTVNSHTIALQTARVIASTPSHRSHNDVAELLRTFEKGWIDQRKFAEVLQGLLF